MLVEVHHLEAVELIGNFFDLLLLTRLNILHIFSIPSDVLPRRRFVLTTSLHGTAGDLSIVDVCNLVVRDRTSYNLYIAHGDEYFDLVFDSIHKRRVRFRIIQGAMRAVHPSYVSAVRY